MRGRGPGPAAPSPLSVGTGAAEADEPVDHRSQYREQRQEQQRRGVDQLLLAEEGAARAEQGRAHPPGVARDALGEARAAKADEVEVERGEQRRDRRQREMGGRGIAEEPATRARRREAGRSRSGSGRSRSRPRARRARMPPDSPVPPPRRRPGGRHQIDREDRSHGARCRATPRRPGPKPLTQQHQHRPNEYRARPRMRPPALAQAQGGRCRRRRRGFRRRCGHSSPGRERSHLSPSGSRCQLEYYAGNTLIRL